MLRKTILLAQFGETYIVSELGNVVGSLYESNYAYIVIL